MRLTTEQLAEIHRRIEERLDELGMPNGIRPNLGVVRLAYGVIDEWWEERDSETIEDYANARAAAYEHGYKAGLMAVQSDANARSNGKERGPWQQFLSDLDVAIDTNARQGQPPIDRSGDWDDEPEPPGYDHIDEFGGQADPTEFVDDDDDEPILLPGGAKLVTSAYLERTVPGYNDLPDDDDDDGDYGDDDSGQQPTASSQQPLSSPIGPTRPDGDLHRVRPLEKPSPQAVAVLGPEHTVVTPLPEPDLARARLASALAEANTAHGGELRSLVNRQPRTLAEADAAEAKRHKAQRRPSLDGPAPKRKPRQQTTFKGQPIVTREQVIAEVQRQAMAGMMPTQAQFNESKPATWPEANSFCSRLGRSWTELAAEAGLKPNRKVEA